MNRNSLSREILAEFIGTYVLILFGAANVAQVVLSHEKNGVYLSINIAWGLAVMMGIFVAGGVSGAHSRNDTRSLRRCTTPATPLRVASMKKPPRRSA